MKLLEFIKYLDNYSITVIIVGFLFHQYLQWYFEEKRKKEIQTKTDETINKEASRIIEWLEKDTNHPCMTVKNQLDNQKWREDILNSIKDFKDKLNRVIDNNEEIDRALNKLITLIEQQLRR